MSAAKSAEDPSAARIALAFPAAMTRPAVYPGGGRVETHETHASWVFLTGDRAYKVKKPVRLDFLDYSTLKRRRAACREEVRVNADLAPGIYLGVRGIVAAAGGARLVQQGARDAVEYAVEMRRFDESRTLHGAIRARSLTDADVREVARLLADFHGRCEPLGGEGADEMRERWLGNARELERLEHPDGWSVPEIARFGDAFLRAHADEIQARAQAGLVRDCHGDLRCEHVLLGDPIRVVDRIEFDARLRHMDVARDLAFLTMDLEAHGRRAAARKLVSAYREAGGDAGSEALRSFYAAYWSIVRAKVALIAASERSGRPRGREHERALRLWKLAERLCWRSRRPVAIVVCGAAASGKSTLARELAHSSGLPVVSSDDVRKRRAGVQAHERARPEHYASRFTRATYDLLGRQAVARIDRAGGVIIDASCHTRSRRATLFERLRAHPGALLVVHCNVTLTTALARARARMTDPQRISDATPEIVEQQFRRFQGLGELPGGSVLELDAEQDLDHQLTDVRRALDEGMRAVSAFPPPISAFTR